MSVSLTDRENNNWPRVYARECGPSLTKQSSRDECNINLIMAKYAKTGVLEHLNEHKGDYGDFADAGTFLESQIIIQEASEMFQSIPSEIRKEFDNDPAKFLDFVQNPENLEEMVEMGLASRDPQDLQNEAPDPEPGSGSPKDQATDKTPPKAAKDPPKAE